MNKVEKRQRVVQVENLRAGLSITSLKDAAVQLYCLCIAWFGWQQLRKLGPGSNNYYYLKIYCVPIPYAKCFTYIKFYYFQSIFIAIFHLAEMRTHIYGRRPTSSIFRNVKQVRAIMISQY